MTVQLGAGYRPLPAVEDIPVTSPSKDELVQEAILAALLDLKAAIAPPPPPTVMIDPPDLTDIVNAVTGLKAQATPNEIAEAIVARFQPPTAVAGPDATLTKVANALELLEHRLQGISFQAYGGGAVNMLVGTQPISSLNPVPVSGTVTTTQGTSPWVVDVLGDADITVDPNNSTTTALTASTTFTGTATDVSAYEQINVELFATPSTAKASLYFEFSPDSTNWDISIPILVRDPTLFIPYPLVNVGRYFRVRLLNDGGSAAITSLGLSDTPGTPTTQTVLRLQTQRLPSASKELARSLDQGVSGSDPVVLTRSVTTGRSPTGAYKNIPFSGSSILNTTTALLGANGTFTGTFEDITGWSTVSVILRANQNAASSGLQLQFSTDGTTVDRIVTREYNDAPNGDFYAVPTQAQFFRVVYTNGVAAQTGTWVLETRYDVEPLPQSIGTLTATLADNNLAVMTRSLIAAKDRTTGTYANIVSEYGGLNTALRSMTAMKASQGTTSGTAGQVTQILNPALTGRKSVTISNMATNANTDRLYVGQSNGVTTSTGYELTQGASMDIDIDDTVNIFLVSNNASIKWSAMEVGGT